MEPIDAIDFEKAGGLITAVTLDDATGDVLMVAYMNSESFRKTLELGEVVYWSRSRNELWVKGESSGHTQEVAEILIDCDDDTVLLKVRQTGGAACHEGYKSCFFRSVREAGARIEITETRLETPEAIYGRK